MTHAVLVVEDEGIVAADLQQTLLGLGYDAFAVAASADEAIARAEERRPDLVLMDIRLKGPRDGIEAAEIFRTRFSVPVVYLTAHADEATVDRAKKTQPYGYLLKPITSAELRSVIEVSLHRCASEREQREAVADAELADRLTSLATMAGGVAHEVNNPLSVVVANAAFVSDELKQCRSAAPAAGEAPLFRQRLDGLIEALDDVLSASNRIARTVRDLKGFSRPNHGTAGVVDVVKCVEWAVRTIAHELDDRARLVIHAGAPSLLVAGDEVRLGQVLVTILLKAARAIAPGDLERNKVSVEVRRDRERAVVEISDSGAGMSRQVVARLFEPMLATDSGGMGLAMCQNIIRALGGEIEVESEVERGATFRFSLPLVEPPEAPLLGETTAPLRGRILVVDDEPLVRSALQRVLKDHALTCVDSAEEALRRIDSEPPFDLILADVMMPVMSGIDLYEAILKKNPALAQRIVFISGGVNHVAARVFLATTKNPVVDKPFVVERLLAVIQEQLKAL